MKTKEAILSGHRPIIPADLSTKITFGPMVAIIKKCWSHHPIQRPTAGELLKELAGKKSSSSAPVPPPLPPKPFHLRKYAKVEANKSHRLAPRGPGFAVTPRQLQTQRAKLKPIEGKERERQPRIDGMVAVVSRAIRWRRRLRRSRAVEEEEDSTSSAPDSPWKREDEEEQVVE